jgi:hypothetical protein
VKCSVPDFPVDTSQMVHEDGAFNFANVAGKSERIRLALAS